MGSGNVIELNGKKYDALTGALLDITPEPSHSTFVKPLAVHAPSHHGSVDGMMAAKHVAHAAAKPKITKKLPTAAHKAASVTHHQPERSKTLMRHAVKAPVIAPKTSTKTVAPLQKTLPAKLAVKPKLSSDVIDPSRNKRAQTANRSQMVRRFNSTTPARPGHHTAPTVAQVQPTAKPIQQLPIIHNQPQPRVRPNAHDIRRPAATQAAPVRRSMEQQSKALFENALASASSHEQSAPKESRTKKARRGAKKRSKLLSVAAAVAVFVLLAGFIAYQNRANIELQLASAKAGFHVTTPLYKPSGFALGKLTYSPGTASLAYKNSNNQSFNVSQKESNWDSQTLLDNYVVVAGNSYQGFQSNGRTVYVYGDGNATWVNGGIWYQIHADSSLDSDQLVKIAASM
jgi:hypothetical protein